MDLDVEIAHKASHKSRFERALAIVIGLAAIIAALLATLEMHSSKRWEQASTEAADLSVELFGKIAATGPFRAAGADAEQTALALSIEGIERTRQSNARGFDFVRAYIDNRVANRLLRLTEDISAAPDESSGLDPVAREVLATSLHDLEEIGAHQDEQVDAAEHYGARLNRAIFALSLLALAAILIGLAAVLGIEHSGPIVLVLASVVLFVSAAFGVSALLV
jgi:hypothetical protein